MSLYNVAPNTSFMAFLINQTQQKYAPKESNSQTAINQVLAKVQALSDSDTSNKKRMLELKSLTLIFLYKVYTIVFSN